MGDKNGRDKFILDLNNWQNAMDRVWRRAIETRCHERQAACAGDENQARQDSECARSASSPASRALGYFWLAAVVASVGGGAVVAGICWRIAFGW